LSRFPVHAAAQLGDVAALQRALDTAALGAPADATDDDKWTPLHYAAWEGHADAVARLLEAGFPVRAANAAGATPIHLAAGMGRVAALAVLLSACRAPEDLQQLNEDRQTPLQLAEKLCEESKDQVVAMLVARAAELAAAALSVAADEPAQ